MILFLHLICGTTFLGVIIANFFYIRRSIGQGDQLLIDYSLRASYFGDRLIFFLIIALMITASKLINNGHFSLVIPWIIVAHIAFGTVILLWLATLFIKRLCLSKTPIPPLAVRIFSVLQTLIIIIFLLIIHDAVTQSTWFAFLFRK